MNNRPRVHALDKSFGFWIYGGPRPYGMTLGILGCGAYHYLSCGTCEEQSGCYLSDEDLNSPPDIWISIEQMGFNRRIGWDEKQI